MIVVKKPPIIARKILCVPQRWRICEEAVLGLEGTMKGEAREKPLGVFFREVVEDA